LKSSSVKRRKVIALTNNKITKNRIKRGSLGKNKKVSESRRKRKGEITKRIFKFITINH
jgi:hypothetical protein